VIRFLNTVLGAVLAAVTLTIIVVLALGGAKPTPPTNTETLTCVRVKEVTPAGTINYLCEVRK
jgi:hypothetical protein